MQIPKSHQNDLRFAINYKNPGRCPKCNHLAWIEGQAGAMPPRLTCICGWSSFEPRDWVGYRRLVS